MIYEDEFNPPEKNQQGTFYLQVQYDHLMLVQFVPISTTLRRRCLFRVIEPGGARILPLAV
ncbi:MAG: hypothetical protein NTW21_08550 [Verrucomicrobia bacterium]|nr:hypothetical protein [Verrucomicrobiota bacterium]